MSDLSVPCAAETRVTVSFDAQHRCPFRDEADYGTVEVTWTTSFGETVELHALAVLVRGREDEPVSHEQWTADLYGSVNASVNVRDLTVTSRWSTAGAVVTVSSGSVFPDGGTQ